MVWTFKNILIAIFVTLLAIVMLICGGFILYKRVSNTKFAIYNRTTLGIVLIALDYISTIIFIPGTILFYWLYIRSITNCSK
ncbi:MV membrane protein [Brazilian porcupinepox virus 1]|nr:MV membrane protein [Brazilian porcupinepox virus 1]